MSVDAHGGDRCHVHIRGDGSGRPHLVVRTGPVAMYCLDGAAVTSIAAAWAMAYASSVHLLPVAATTTPRGREPARGIAAPVGDVAVEGHQRWDVTPPRPGQSFALVASDWMSIRIHDVPALETYTRAWATACAAGARVLRTPPVPFGQLLRTADHAELTHRYRLEPDSDRPVGRTR